MLLLLIEHSNEFEITGYHYIFNVLLSFIIFTNKVVKFDFVYFQFHTMLSVVSTYIQQACIYVYLHAAETCSVVLSGLLHCTENFLSPGNHHLTNK